MIKGWRNDPQWIAHYAARDAGRIEREILRVKMEMHLQQLNEAAEAAIQRMNNPPRLVPYAYEAEDQH